MSRPFVVPFGLVLVLFFGATSASANVIWNEASDGDLMPETNPTWIPFPIGTNDVVGTVGGDPNNPLQDAFDAFRVDVPAGAMWNEFTLVSHVPNPPNQTTGFVIYEGTSSLTGVFLNGIPAAGSNVDLFALMVLGPLGPGSYTVGIRDFESQGNEYQVRVSLIPEPCLSSSWLACLVAGLAWVGRR